MDEKKPSYVNDKLREFISRSSENRTQNRVVCKKGEAKWLIEQNGSKIARLISPENGFDIRSHNLAIVEVPPGGKGPLHRHGDAAIFILSGKGYAIVDGKRYDYEEGDAALMPAWVWHQQFNASPDNPLRFLAAQAVFPGIVISDEEPK